MATAVVAIAVIAFTAVAPPSASVPSASVSSASTPSASTPSSAQTTSAPSSSAPPSASAPTPSTPSSASAPTPSTPTYASAPTASTPSASTPSSASWPNASTPTYGSAPTASTPSASAPSSAQTASTPSSTSWPTASTPTYVSLDPLKLLCLVKSDGEETVWPMYPTRPYEVTARPTCSARLPYRETASPTCSARRPYPATSPPMFATPPSKTSAPSDSHRGARCSRWKNAISECSDAIEGYYDEATIPGDSDRCEAFRQARNLEWWVKPTEGGGGRFLPEQLRNETSAIYQISYGKGYMLCRLDVDCMGKMQPPGLYGKLTMSFCAATVYQCGRNVGDATVVTLVVGSTALFLCWWWGGDYWGSDHLSAELP